MNVPQEPRDCHTSPGANPAGKRIPGHRSSRRRIALCALAGTLLAALASFYVLRGPHGYALRWTLRGYGLGYTRPRLEVSSPDGDCVAVAFLFSSIQDSSVSFAVFQKGSFNPCWERACAEPPMPASSRVPWNLANRDFSIVWLDPDIVEFRIDEWRVAYYDAASHTGHAVSIDEFSANRQEWLDCWRESQAAFPSAGAK